MDKKYIKEKLKKYLFFVSIVFLSLSSVHLIYNYVYSDSKEVAQKGGSISESFVGAFPNLNPLKYNNDYNAYINHILYRSLLTYDSKQRKIVGDLATCDISNLSKIECFLDDSIKWSNGDSITIEDILSTYNIIKQTDVNPVLKSTLENITITPKEGSILFESTTSDVNILNIFFQKILPKETIEKINIEKIDGNLSPINGIYSGKYKISKVDQDETTGFTKIFLEKNNLYTLNPVYIDNIILKFYKDYPVLLQQKNNINIFNDKKQLIGDSIPKLQNNKYILPQYISAFINKDRLEYPNLRNYILSKIDSNKLLQNIGEENNKKIDSPFLNELKINTFSNNSNLDTMMRSLGYHKKDYYLSQIGTKEKIKETYSPEVEIKKEEKTNTGSTIEKDIETINTTEITNSITKENYNTKSKIIISPEWVDKYNFITNPSILLEGVVSNNVSEVYINDYKLENYKQNSGKFYYRLSTDIGNIKLGQNDYKIYFVENGKKSEKEIISFIYDTNKQNLEKKEIDIIAKLTNEKVEEAKKLALEVKEKQEKKINEEQKENTVVQKTLNQEEIEKQNLIKALDDKFYYDKNFNVYSLNLSYIEGSNQIDKTVEEIKNQLENAGIEIEVNSIKLTDLINQIKENKENYDILITGINLGYFNFNISKYFYSGQTSEGINFSKIKNSELDNILEDLKSSLLGDTKKLELEKSIIKILSTEAVFKPLYSPYYSNLVIKNIEGYELPEIIPDDIYRFDPLTKSYILKEKIINKSSKNILGFIKYLFNNLF